MEFNIATLEQLSKLTLHTDEETALAAHITSILAYVNKLQEAPTHNIGITPRAVLTRETLRKDIATPSDEVTQSLLLSDAPSVRSGQIEAPGVFE